MIHIYMTDMPLIQVGFFSQNSILLFNNQYNVIFFTFKSQKMFWWAVPCVEILRVPVTSHCHDDSHHIAMTTAIALP